jgi:NADPH-dependent 2,4-dienoyl-CoA reductase/sulfur reductase-like enzyme/rhodanese-related sulfurtransferase
MPENAPVKIVIIGASAAGLRAASRARRRNPQARVTVIDADSIISYGACGMPYFVSGDIDNAKRLRTTPYGTMRDPDFFRMAKGIEVLIETEAFKIDRESKKVLCRDLKSNEEKEVSYDKLVLAIGAKPVMIPGAPREAKRITTFKTLHEAIHLRKSLERGEISKVGIVGGGFIGCEMAEAFGSLWGAEVVLLEAAPFILPTLLDEEMARAVEAYMKTEGVDLRTCCSVESMVETEKGVVIKTKDGDFEVDCAVVAVGVKPATGLAADCGLEVGITGGIVVDESMRTSDPDIYAAGDCVEVKHLVSGKPCSVPLGSLANRQGRLIGSNLGGGEERFRPIVGSAAVKVFDMNVACTGLTETAASEAGFNVGCAWGTFHDLADYYPESQNIHLKLVFDKKSGKLLGLQAYGKGEVVKRVDVFAALLRHEGTLADLLDMEFAYAPPYAPAVDPLYSLACAARNAVLEGIDGLSPSTELDGRMVIDVRLAQEVEDSPLPMDNVKNIPFEELRERWKELPSDKPLVLFCARGLRSAESTRILKEMGLTDAVYLGGGSYMRTK